MLELNQNILTNEVNLKTLDLAHKIIYALEGKKGGNILLLDIHKIASFTDYFIICTGTSDRMIKSLAEAALGNINKISGINQKFRGLPSSGWLVADLGDIVVHIFSPDQREYYQLEQLWENGKVLLHLQ